MNKYTSAGQMHKWKSVMHLFQNRKTMWLMIREALKGQYRMSFITILVLSLGILYVLFPFDLISDFLPVLGWIDDGAVFYFIMKRLHTETQRFNRHKAMERRTGH